MKQLAIFLLVTYSSFGQKVDYNSIILPKTARDIDFAERLVQLAWQNNPGSEILNRERIVSNLKLKQARRNWLENIRITGNLNEFNLQSIGGEPSSQSLFFPRYNVSATLSLGVLFSDPIKSKIEKEGVEIATQNINQQKLSLRAVVLSKFQTYLSYKEVLEIRVQMERESNSDHTLKEQSFKRGEIPLTELNISLDRYNQQQINRALAEKDLMVSQLELEALIGMKLADVQ